MTYTEWRDELKSNLLCVSENERRRVLDYYAEAYADRREAGYTEREIIADFGAPYDAAQRILYEKVDDGDYADEKPPELTRREIRRENRERRREQAEREQESRRGNGREQSEQSTYAPPPPPPRPAPQPAYTNGSPAPAACAAKSDYTWVFVLLCVIFWAPLFGLIMTMVGITIALCVAPVAVIGGGAAAVGAGIGALFGAQTFNAFFSIGAGLILIGIGVMLCPIFFKLVGLMWKLFSQCLKWIKSLFSGKEQTK